MKRWFSVLAALLAAALLIGCGSQAAEPSLPTEKPRTEADPEAVPEAVTGSDLPEPERTEERLYLRGWEPLLEDFRCLFASSAENGSYYREDMRPDGLLAAYQWGFPLTPTDSRSPEEQALEAALSLADGEAQEPTLRLDEGYSARLSYPVYLAEYSTGRNEDTRRWLVYVTMSDSACYLFGLSAAMDEAEALDDTADAVFSQLTLADWSMGDVADWDMDDVYDWDTDDGNDWGTDDDWGEGAPAPDEDRTEEVAALAGYWYPDGDEGAALFLWFDDAGNWAWYARTVGDPEASLSDGGTVVPSAGEPNAFYAENYEQTNATWFTVVPSYRNDDGGDCIIWGDGGFTFLRVE